MLDLEKQVETQWKEKVNDLQWEWEKNPHERLRKALCRVKSGRKEQEIMKQVWKEDSVQK